MCRRALQRQKTQAQAVQYAEVVDRIDQFAECVLERWIRLQIYNTRQNMRTVTDCYGTAIVEYEYLKNQYGKRAVQFLRQQRRVRERWRAVRASERPPVYFESCERSIDRRVGSDGEETQLLRERCVQ